MVLAASAAFDTMMAGQSMIVAASCTITLPVVGVLDVTGNVSDVSLDCQNNSDLPSNLRDVEGESVTGGTITLTGFVDVAGALWSLVDLLNPDCATFPTGASIPNPLYRQKVKGSLVSFQFGGRPDGGTAETLPKLTNGILTSFPINHTEGTVALSVADASASWRALPDVPAIVTAAPYNAGLTSEWVMDAILRTQWGDSTWPATRPSCVFAASFRASTWPEVGTFLLNAGAPQPLFAHGPYGSALVSARNDAQPGYNVVPYVTSGPVGTRAYLAMQVFGLVTRGATSINFGSPSEVMAVSVRSTGVTVQSLDAGAHVTTHNAATTFDDGLHTIECVFTLPAVAATAWTVSIYVDGVLLGTSATKNLTTARSSDQWLYLSTDTTTGLTPAFGAGLAAVQLTTETAPTITPFTSRAFLDESFNPLTLVPEIAAGTAPMDELTTIADAELGYARVDETGVFRFSNRATLAGRGITDGGSARVVTEATALKDVTTVVGAATDYNRIQVPYTTYSFGPAALVWTISTTKRVNVGQTLTWVQALDDGVLAANMTGPLTVLANGHTTGDGGNYFRASTDPNGNTENKSTNLHGAVTQIDANHVRISFTNASSRPVYFVSPASYIDLGVGAFSLWIGGVPVTADAGSIAEVTYGPADSVYQFPGNVYLQFEGTATAVGDWLLNQLLVSIRDFEGVDVVPNARHQIGDLVRLQSAKARLDEYARIWGWTFTASFPASGETGGTWGQSLNLRALGPPGAWLGGIAGRSDGGTTTYGYG